MTKQEIIDAVEKGIEGQGTMVDLGGVLPKILKAIVDALPDGGSAPSIVDLSAIALTDDSVHTREEIDAACGAGTFDNIESAVGFYINGGDGVYDYYSRVSGYPAPYQITDQEGATLTLSYNKEAGTFALMI